MKISGARPQVTSGASAKRPTPKNQPRRPSQSAGVVGKKGEKINITA